MAIAVHRRIETLRQGVAEFAMEKMPLAGPRGKQMLREAGPLRPELREGKTQTEQDQRLAEECQRLAEERHRQAEESQTLMWGMRLPLAGFG